jgi:hypothetical protein
MLLVIVNIDIILLRIATSIVIDLLFHLLSARLRVRLLRFFIVLLQCLKILITVFLSNSGKMNWTFVTYLTYWRLQTALELVNLHLRIYSVKTWCYI